MLVGCIDDADRTQLRGWVRSSVHPDMPVPLLLTANDRLLDRIVANRYRPDLERAGIGNGRFGFELALRPPLDPFRSWVVHLRAEDTGEDMPGSPFRLDPASDFDVATRAAVADMLMGFANDEDAARRHAFLLELGETLSRSRAERRIRAPVATDAPPPAGRALVIDAHCPDPDSDGGSVAIVSHMRALQRLGHTVQFAAQLMPRDTEAADHLQRLGIGVCRSPEFGSVEEVLRRNAGCFDLVYLHRLPVASAYAGLVRHYQPRAHLVYGIADLHHLRLARQAAFENRPELNAAVQHARRNELWCAANADAVITHSPVEAALLRRALPAARVNVVRWSLRCDRRDTPFARRRHVGFVGNFAHAPNLAAAFLLRDTIMPMVRQVDPVILCRLAGDNLPLAIRRDHAGLDVLGRVAELDDMLSELRLTVAPLGYGAGLKAKVLQSFAAGVPCVCSPIAAEGLDLPAELGVLVAEDDRGIASLILRLHQDEALNNRLSDLVLRFARTLLDESVVDAAMAEAVKRPRRP